MVIRVLRWVARILVIIAILFMVMFSLDVFEMDKSFWEKILGFLIHNVSAIVLAAILVVAWKKEVAGGILLIIASIVMMQLYHAFTTNKGVLVMMLPVLLAGVLFIICQFSDLRKTKNKSGNVKS